jgi:hypothetical protein
MRLHLRDAQRGYLLPAATTTEQVVCFGSKEYVPLFPALTHAVRGERMVFYNSVTPPSAPGCKLIRFETGQERTDSMNALIAMGLALLSA